MVQRVSFARGGYPDARSINTIVTNYKAFVGVVESECYRIMQEAADMTLDYIMPLVPVQFGGLKESARAEAVRTPKGVMARVSFGGVDASVTPTPNAPTGIVMYAAIVNYNGNGNSSSPYFMERGSLASRQEVDGYIKSELKKIKPKPSRKR